ncbi:hypothetical protein MGAST_03505 [Mycobacterium gastri 'Wayne']|nr:hypothetical protein MGAST_03505 [Mycobacterium gastri 'Wayne']
MYPQAYEVLANVWYLGRRARIWDRLVAASGARDGEKVLDVGCGTGYFARRISPVVGPAGAVTGIDPSKAALDYAAAHTPPNCTFQAGHAEELPFADHSFDLVVSSLTFHHIPNEHRANAVREMFRVVRPGGRMLIADIRSPRVPLLEWLTSVAHGDADVHNVFDRLKAMTVNTGFTITETGNATRLYYIAAERPRRQPSK